MYGLVLHSEIQGAPDVLADLAINLVKNINTNKQRQGRSKVSKSTEMIFVSDHHSRVEEESNKLEELKPEGMPTR